MQLLNNPQDMNTLANNNPTENIGKYTINMDKVTSTALNFTDGHTMCIQKLRDIGCRIVIVEFINAYDLYIPNNPTMTFLNPPEILDPTSVLNRCDAQKLDADFIMYNCDVTITPQAISLVDSRLITEDYKTKLMIPDQLYELLKMNLYWFESRNTPSNVTIARSYKSGSETLALYHYINKYCTFGFLPVEPVKYPGTNIPVANSVDINEVSDETKNFADYFEQIDNTAIENYLTDNPTDSIELYATNLGYNAEKTLIIDDPNFVGSDNIFATTIFKGPYNSDFIANRWFTKTKTLPIKSQEK